MRVRVGEIAHLRVRRRSVIRRSAVLRQVYPAHSMRTGGLRGSPLAERAVRKRVGCRVERTYRSGSRCGPRCRCRRHRGGYGDDRALLCWHRLSGLGRAEAACGRANRDRLDRKGSRIEDAPLMLHCCIGIAFTSGLQEAAWARPQYLLPETQRPRCAELACLEELLGEPAPRPEGTSCADARSEPDVAGQRQRDPQDRAEARDRDGEEKTHRLSPA